MRSVHPSHSLASVGALAAEICRDHEWSETPCGAGTPYAKLLELDCSVLMFGATLDGYTFFHTAEHDARCPYLYEPHRQELLFRDERGLVWSLPSLRHDMQVPRRFREMDAWLADRSLLHRQTLGSGELLFIPCARAVHRALVEALQRDPWLLVKEPQREST